jgi:hypothetical protein
MHTLENGYEQQAFHIEEMPAPVRDIRVQRVPEGIELTWPFRENDFSYTVYRRVLPKLTFEPVARNLDVRRFVDTSGPADATVSYTLSALTNETEPLDGTVNWGDSRVYSAAVSRIEEEVIVYPETEIATSAPVTVLGKGYPEYHERWPAIEGLSEEDAAVALEVAVRMESLQRAVEMEHGGGTAGFFARDYVAGDGSNAAFASASLNAFFDAHDACRLFLQPHQWSVEAQPEPSVSLVTFVELSGIVNETDIERVPPRAQSVVTFRFAPRDGEWCIISTDPPFPALNNMLGEAR